MDELEKAFDQHYGSLYNGMHPYREQYLQHFGVKGMKWGHRKNRAAVQARKAKTQARYEKRFKESGDYRLKNVSDRELREKINRLQMEKQYRELNPTAVESGRKAANDLIVGPVKNATSQQVAAYAAGAVGLAIATHLVSKGNIGKYVPTPDKIQKLINAQND